MISAQENFRHFQSSKLFGTRVVRILFFALQGFRKTLLGCGFVFAEHAGNMPGHGIDQNHRVQLSAGKHVIPDRDFFIDPTSVGIAKSFNPNPAPINGVSALTITLTNPNPGTIGGYNFIDNLPANMLVATPPAATTTGCGSRSARATPNA